MVLRVLRLVEERFHRDADDDRPLRESRTPDEHLRPGEIELRTCLYAGSRRGRPMNVSALKQTGARWDDLLGALAALRTAYTRARGGDLARLDLLDVWRISQLGSALPWFFLLRDAAGRTPAWAAALSKATLGTGILAQRLFVEALAAREVPPLTPAALLEGAEWTGTLVSDAEACAAPEKMILHFLDVLVGPAPAAAAPPPLLVASEREVLIFGGHYLALKHLMWMYFLARRFLYADLAGALDGPLGERARSLFDAGCEPPDFFVVGPDQPASVAPAQRAVWLATLAQVLVPFAPDGSDLPLRRAADALAAALAAEPSGQAAIADEVARGTHAPPSTAPRVARAIATLATLDRWFAETAGLVEHGFAGAFGDAAPTPAPLDAAARDRLLADPPRALCTTLAPASWAALTAP
ncbi:MAG: hypothetical protein ACTHU0_32625 [Kofleriaceae bacterium]